MSLQRIISTITVITFFVFSFFNFPLVNLLKGANALTSPIVSLTQLQANTYKINLSFSSDIPQGNIVDVEVYNSSNQRIWQGFTLSGGKDFSFTTIPLGNEKYSISVGLFTPNWSSNYAWFDKISSISPTDNSKPGAPTVSANKLNDNSYQLSINFQSFVQPGNIIDAELYNSSNQKIWQEFTDKGGNSFNPTTISLKQGTYTLSVGLFTPNWSSNYAWFGNVYTINVNNLTPTTSVTVTPTPTVIASPTPSNPTPTPSPVVGSLIPQNSDTLNTAQNAYSAWKSKYLQSFNGDLRVIRPDNSNDTVSEGIGYGMLLSVFAGDENTFSGLWRYAQKYLDSKGLMNWQISSDGNVIGQGSATDADEDMAYALIRAESKWPNKGYGDGARKLISSMLNTEVLSSNLINPGDNWGNTPIMNPSYIAPAFYREFASFTGNFRWNDVANANLSWLSKASNQNTGLVPDWLNSDFSQPSISWDKYPNGFYYDAVRTPIRLLMDYKWNGSTQSKEILTKESNFLSSIGASKLLSGYTLDGKPLTSYIDSTFMAAYASAAHTDPASSFAKDSLSSLISQSQGNYFGDSLRAISLFVMGGAK